MISLLRLFLYSHINDLRAIERNEIFSNRSRVAFLLYIESNQFLNRERKKEREHFQKIQYLLRQIVILFYKLIVIIILLLYNNSHNLPFFIRKFNLRNKFYKFPPFA